MNDKNDDGRDSGCVLFDDKGDEDPSLKRRGEVCDDGKSRERS